MGEVTLQMADIGDAIVQSMINVPLQVEVRSAGRLTPDTRNILQYYLRVLGVMNAG